ncbi:unnamed protein product [Effrenium voratum]|uniref:Uncharacterized protein n=1 Tax=Effrenium voratum TaxID=2562239 RepID=A0AA36HU13_9DINO|nr:unnamed protein product [Effrenium voratum]CAJ1457056.1 unnamed protein product [Effrenium voratum]
MNAFSIALLLSAPLRAVAWADWCRYVPYYSQQYVAACSSYAPYSGGCAGWCQWVPSPSWVYVAECQACYRSFVSQPGQRTGLKVKTESALFGLPEWCQNVPLGALKHVAECGGNTPVGVAGAGDFAQGSPAPQEAAADAAAAKAEGADADAKVTGVHEEPGATGADANPKASANPTSADATGSEILP